MKKNNNKKTVWIKLNPIMKYGGAARHFMEILKKKYVLNIESISSFQYGIGGFSKCLQASVC